MNKIKLFLDFDSTIVDSTQAFCKVYDSIHGTNTNYTKIEQYDFSPVLNLSQQEISDIFADERFFHYLKFFDGVENVLKKFEDYYDYVIVTIGTVKNLYLKNLWLQENTTFEIKDFIGINNFIKDRKNPNRMDKSLINMQDGIFMDDHINNINSSNAEIRILFQEENRNHNWSKPTLESKLGDETLWIARNWTDNTIEKILNECIYGF